MKIKSSYYISSSLTFLQYSVLKPIFAGLLITYDVLIQRLSWVFLEELFASVALDQVVVTRVYIIIYIREAAFGKSLSQL